MSKGDTLASYRSQFPQPAAEGEKAVCTKGAPEVRLGEMMRSKPGMQYCATNRKPLWFTLMP